MARHPPISEPEVLAALAVHAEMAKRAVQIMRKHGRAIGERFFDPTSDAEESARLDINGDVATLHYKADGWESEHQSSVEFDARYLWSRDALAAACRAYRKACAEERAAEERRKEERARDEYERLRRRFESTDLRTDILRAMDIEARIAREDAPSPEADGSGR